MNVQFIEQDGQRQYAVVPVDLYTALLEKAEMLDDIRAFDRATSSDEETIPHEWMCRLLNEESKLKVWREYRQLTQAELAKKSGVAQASIAQIESGKRRGSLPVLRKVTQVLGIDLDDVC